MKTPEEIIRWCDTMLNRHPNIEDTNFFNSIKDYMKNDRPHGEWVSKRLWDNTHVWVCSECGNCNTHGITVEKACWRCGADMRKGGAE